MAAEIVTTHFIAHDEDLGAAYEAWRASTEASGAEILAFSPRPHPIDDDFILWDLRTEAAYGNLRDPASMGLYELNALVDFHGIDRGAPRVAKATKLFQGHAISPAKAAAIIRYEVDAGTYLIATSHDVPLGRWAQVNMPWAYRGVMKALNKGLRWAADGAEAT